MPAQRDKATQATLDQLLRDYDLTDDTRLYREAMRDALTPTATPGVYRLAANSAPGDSVIDVYGQGHLIQAAQAGPGLSFAESSRPDWQETMELRVLKAKGGRESLPDRVEVAVRLQDILRQGGLLYPVESVTVERAWYFTLPEGSVVVREVWRG